MMGGGSAPPVSAASKSRRNDVAFRSVGLHVLASAAAAAAAAAATAAAAAAAAAATAAAAAATAAAAAAAAAEVPVGRWQELPGDGRLGTLAGGPHCFLEGEPVRLLLALALAAVQAGVLANATDHVGHLGKQQKQKQKQKQ